MNKIRGKIKRYLGLFKTVVNWPQYLWWKFTSGKGSFKFKIRRLGEISVPRKMIGPFRENFFDHVYLANIPSGMLEKKAPVIIDIGANVGYFSLAALASFPTAHLFSFEPHPYCFGVLQDHRDAFPGFDWEIQREAVGSTAGSITLSTKSVDEFTTKAGNLQKEDDWVQFECPSTQLDGFIDEKNLETVDLLKLDCEGAEYDILYNLPDQSFDQIKAICAETHRGDGRTENNTTLAQYLKEKGYTVKAEKNDAYTGYIWAWRV